MLLFKSQLEPYKEVQSALTNVNRVNERLTQAINQLVPLADNSALRTAKTKLDEEINKSVTTDGMTQSSIKHTKVLNVRVKQNQQMHKMLLTMVTQQINKLPQKKLK